ncbi:MAG: serine/threonine-protein kinase RsbW [Nocardioidaceae bacterium]|jgi:serine/threonine-protein kinase RsbW|nr:serine/threonine-protein kinase RsbW [Nocardioidaceae bacterium]
MRCEAAEPTGELTFRGPAEPGCLEQVHSLMHQMWAREPGVPPDDRFMFATALAELLANIIEHGRQENGEPPDLVLNLSVQGDRIQACVLDNGIAAPVDVDVAELPDDSAESGRGLALVRAAVHDFEYERQGVLNTWRLRRRCCDAEAD